jgi:hypothetical protein
VFHEVSTESPDLSKEAVGNWIIKLPSIMDGYEPKSITNGDETGVFFSCITKQNSCLKSSDGKTLQRKVGSFPLWCYDRRVGETFGYMEND